MFICSCVIKGFLPISPYLSWFYTVLSHHLHPHQSPFPVSLHTIIFPSSSFWQTSLTSNPAVSRRGAVTGSSQSIPEEAVTYFWMVARSFQFNLHLPPKASKQLTLFCSHSAVISFNLVIVIPCFCFELIQTVLWKPKHNMEPWAIFNCDECVSWILFFIP